MGHIPWPSLRPLAYIAIMLMPLDLSVMLEILIVIFGDILHLKYLALTKKNLGPSTVCFIVLTVLPHSLIVGLLPSCLSSHSVTGIWDFSVTCSSFVKMGAWLDFLIQWKLVTVIFSIRSLHFIVKLFLHHFYTNWTSFPSTCTIFWYYMNISFYNLLHCLQAQMSKAFIVPLLHFTLCFFHVAGGVCSAYFKRTLPSWIWDGEFTWL